LDNAASGVGGRVAVGARVGVAVGGIAGVRLGLNVSVGAGVAVGTGMSVAGKGAAVGTGAEVGAAQATNSTTIIKRDRESGKRVRCIGNSSFYKKWGKPIPRNGLIVGQIGPSVKGELTDMPFLQVIDFPLQKQFMR